MIPGTFHLDNYVIKIRIKGDDREVEFGLNDLDIDDPVRLHKAFKIEVAKLHENL